MGEEDTRRQRPNVVRMHMLGAELIPVKSGSATLKDALNEAIRDWVATVETTHYLIGSAAGPHPYPFLVRELQRVIGDEARAQVRERTGRLPDAVVACVGGGSNAIGIFHPFRDDDVRIVGVEAGGDGADLHAASLGRGRVSILHGSRSYVLADEHGQVTESHSDLGRPRLPGRRAGAGAPQGRAGAWTSWTRRTTTRSRRSTACAGWRASSRPSSPSHALARAERWPASSARTASSSSASPAAATRTSTPSWRARGPSVKLVDAGARRLPDGRTTTRPTWPRPPSAAARPRSRSASRTPTRWPTGRRSRRRAARARRRHDAAARAGADGRDRPPRRRAADPDDLRRDHRGLRPRAVLPAAAASGAEGLICVDTPPEESGDLRTAAAAGRHRPRAPRDADLARRAAARRGHRQPRLRLPRRHVGTTGAREPLDDRLAGRSSSSRQAAGDRRRVLGGFGISRPEHVEAVLDAGADGVVVGSAAIDAADRGGPAELESFVRSLAGPCDDRDRARRRLRDPPVRGQPGRGHPARRARRRGLDAVAGGRARLRRDVLPARPRPALVRARASS